MIERSDEEAVAETAAAYGSGKFAMMAVPVELVAEVERLIGRPRAS